MPNTKDLTIYDLTDGFVESLRHSTQVENICSSVFENLIQEVLLDVIFEFHYTLKTRKIDYFEYNSNNENKGFVNEPGLDIFGQGVVKEDQFFTCPNTTCLKKVCSAKFTKHLEECMGLSSRQSSRLAHKRGTNLNSSYSGNGASYDDDEYESENEAWKKTSVRNRGSKKSSKKKNSKKL